MPSSPRSTPVSLKLGARFLNLEAEYEGLRRRISDLEADNAGLRNRVSDLEAENAGLRKPLAEAADRTGNEPTRTRNVIDWRRVCPEACTSESGSSARTPRRKWAVTSDAEDDADVEEAQEGGGGSAGLEDDDVSVTPWGKRRAAARVVTSDSEDEDPGSGKDDVVDPKDGVTASRKRWFCGISDSDDEDATGDVHVVAPKAASRAKCGAVEDDMVLISRVLKKLRKKMVTEAEDGGADDGLREARGCSTSTTRRSARLVKNQSKGGRALIPVISYVEPREYEGSQVALKAASRAESGEGEEDLVLIRQLLKKMTKKRMSKDDDADDELRDARGCSTSTTRRSARLAKKQSDGGRASHTVINFLRPKEYEWSEDDMEEDDDMNGFINDDDSENLFGLPLPNEESSSGAEEPDSVADYAGVMARIGRKKKAEEWKFEGDMLAAFAEHPELCLKAVCALYRKQTQEEQLEKAALVHNGQGFSHIDAPRGSRIAEFLLDGELHGPLKKTIPDLEEDDPYALGFCRKVASNYSKQLFAIYQNKEDPYFHP